MSDPSIFYFGLTFKDGVRDVFGTIGLFLCPIDIIRSLLRRFRQCEGFVWIHRDVGIWTRCPWCVDHSKKETSSLIHLPTNTEDESVDILEADDGSGWVKVVDHQGNSGLVPASYVEIVGGGEEQTTDHDARSKRGRHYVNTYGDMIPLRSWLHSTARAIYPYTAQGSDELTLQPGDILELSSGPNGGDRYADGWWEGETVVGLR